MNAQEIIDLVKGSNPEAGLKGWVAILEDGEALAALGLTDENQNEVEDAYSVLFVDLQFYNRFAGEFGKVWFYGVEYALIEQATRPIAFSLAGMATYRPAKSTPTSGARTQSAKMAKPPSFTGSLTLSRVANRSRKIWTGTTFTA